MFISLSILLILLFSLGFWIVKGSKVHSGIKFTTISLFFLFCAIFNSVWESSMGWAATDKTLPEVVAIRHVVIKEPNKQLQLEGSIHLLLEFQPTKYDSFILNLFAYKIEHSDPRLFRLPYSRKLHEQLQSEVIPRNQQGQIVYGKLGKMGKDGKGGKGNQGKDGKGKDGKQEKNKGGESLEKEWMFYELPPGYFLPKN